MDSYGYPSDDDIDWLKSQLSEMDFWKGANAIIELINKTGYGEAGIEKPHDLIVVTGGWSGCEEILLATHDTVWRAAYWVSSHRGGREVFSATQDGVNEFVRLNLE